MTSRTWPAVGYIRWIAILYLIAAVAAALIAFFLVALLYATKGTLIFLAGAIIGPVIYVITDGFFTYLARMMDAIQNQTRRVKAAYSACRDVGRRRDNP